MENVIREIFGYQVIVGRTPPHCRADSERIIDIIYGDIIAQSAIRDLNGSGPSNAPCELYRKRSGDITLRDLRPL